MVLNSTAVDMSPAVWAILGSALRWAVLCISNRRFAGVETSAVLVFYTLPVSLLIGIWLTWHEVPGSRILVGGAAIVAGGYLTLRNPQGWTAVRCAIR
ncbi:MAG: hypothetical protein QF921_13675 [Pseudomonadales bacterium]|nr:hypothetical protein [Pseudomonadales bacterium]MDP6972534.1 hypothetical protein [Pseudomonadales bacterium]